MMSKGKVAEQLNAADAAINRVLEAERAAQDSIAGCRSNALAILSESRARARAVAERADRRINRLHALSDASLAALREQLQEQARGLSSAPGLTPELSARLDAALDQLLDELLGGCP
jgi:vacuolar-type H+-ATPase subunit H